MERETEKWRERQRNGERDREMERETEKWRERQRNKETERQGDSETEGKRDSNKMRPRARKLRDADTERQRERDIVR